MANHKQVRQHTPSGRPAAWGIKVRERIDSSMVVDRLEAHVRGHADDNPMTQTQINAARILLDRTVPVLKQIEVRAEEVRDIREISAQDLLSIVEGESTRLTTENPKVIK
jgi:hypothetical protein